MVAVLLYKRINALSSPSLRLIIMQSVIENNGKRQVNIHTEFSKDYEYCKAKIKLQLLAEVVIISFNPTYHPPGQVRRRQNRAKL